MLRIIFILFCLEHFALWLSFGSDNIVGAVHILTRQQSVKQKVTTKHQLDLHGGSADNKFIGNLNDSEKAYDLIWATYSKYTQTPIRPMLKQRMLELPYLFFRINIKNIYTAYKEYFH